MELGFVWSANTAYQMTLKYTENKVCAIYGDGNFRELAVLNFYYIWWNRSLFEFRVMQIVESEEIERNLWVFCLQSLKDVWMWIENRGEKVFCTNF